MTTFRPCFLIPCYNHGKTVPAVVDALAKYGYPVIIVDDGSNDETQTILAEQAQRYLVTVITLANNQGKGGAVIAGFEEAFRQSFSHAIQIDADGQHDLDALPKLIDEAHSHPTSVISGCPVYDDSVPKSRLYGRYATHVWVWIETLSMSIKDSMCGFRAYPIGPTIKVLSRNTIGQRMDFDTEILVRMYWDDCDIRFVETKVIYPEDGLSHFDVLWDNVKISAMHTRLFFGMLPRIPRLLKRNKQKKALLKDQDTTTNIHWSKQKERGTVIGIKLLMWVYSIFGRRVFAALLKIVIGYYYLIGASARKESEHFLAQVSQYAHDNNQPLPTTFNSYQHLLSFGHTMLDKLAGWRGDLSTQNITLHGSEHLAELTESKQGIIILGSHLGNLELCRALSRDYKSIKINALVFTEHAERFNSVMKAVNPDSDLNLIQVSSLGPDTAILLQQKLEQGEWVVIVGDRTSVTKEQRSIWADFLGKPAPFPQGPFMLASVLKAPVYLLFGLRDEQQATPHFDVYFELFSKQLTLPRKNRTEALQSAVTRYAERLEHYTMKAPLQWYNFFNFWQLSNKKD
ncbi:glycosyltransferase family 2 protein [Photobacterium sanguinicancri]|uniref:glycosyltransferase family 2 protein n=1 Tax=Photobacterium sanguinicancri TaxID=875932 RepID=UPI0026E20715|nr:glycosyltransferase family 2 protein [Photobacterium sanguinicancri]MDO6498292.1 glycosyltransferase [Photobacterium sanguinicancri]